MERRKLLKGLAALAACQCCAGRGLAAETAHWTYSGENGPAHWGDLDAASASCSLGSQQSPIDIAGATRAELPGIAIGWNAPAGTITDNGHTIQADLSSGGRMTAGEDAYELLQFHFHAPGEHLVDGRSFPMEVHFVHRNAATGGLGVLGAFLAEGAGNPAFAAIVAAMPPGPGTHAAMPPGIDLRALLPASLTYWRYEGSLTTPPCSETVEWRVCVEPVEAAAAEIALFTARYPANARPVQAPNRRFVLRSG